MKAMYKGRQYWISCEIYGTRNHAGSIAFGAAHDEGGLLLARWSEVGSGPSHTVEEALEAAHIRAEQLQITE